MEDIAIIHLALTMLESSSSSSSSSDCFDSSSDGSDDLDLTSNYSEDSDPNLDPDEEKNEKPKGKQTLRCPPKVSKFLEGILHTGDNTLFKEHFHMEKSSVDFLMKLMANAGVTPTHKFGREKISLEKAILLTLWYLTTQESYQQIASRFATTRSAAHMTVKRIVLWLVNHSKQFIKWPSHERALVSAKHFAKQGFKQAIGVIDGCHIVIPKLKEDLEALLNHKGTYSIVMQAVVNEREEFIDLFCGEAGSLEDAQVLKKSSLYSRCLQNKIYDDFYILGDSAYPSLNWLVPPFWDNSYLSPEQQYFNYMHSSLHKIVQITFGTLKSRFKRLESFKNRDITFVTQAVVAACVLHNICIAQNDLHTSDVENLITAQYSDNTVLEQFDYVGVQEDRRLLVFNEMYNCT